MARDARTAPGTFGSLAAEDPPPPRPLPFSLSPPCPLPPPLPPLFPAEWLLIEEGVGCVSTANSEVINRTRAAAVPPHLCMLLCSPLQRGQDPFGYDCQSSSSWGVGVGQKYVDTRMIDCFMISWDVSNI